MPDADHLRANKRELVRAVGMITARVVSHTVSGEMAYVANRRNARDKRGG